MKLREYFLCVKKSKITRPNLFNNFFFSVSDFVADSQQYHDACKQSAVHPGSTLECRLLCQQHHTHASCYSCDLTRKEGIKVEPLMSHGLF